MQINQPAKPNTPTTETATVTEAPKPPAIDIKPTLVVGQTAPSVNPPLSSAEYAPANWNVQAQEDGSVVCTNNITAREFRGTIKEFARFLKG